MNEAFLAAFFKCLTISLCPYCGQSFKGEQIGPCVYCEHCRKRLYNETRPYRPGNKAL